MIFVCVRLCTCVPLTHRPEEDLDLKLQAAASFQMWILGSEPGPSARAASALNIE